MGSLGIAYVGQSFDFEIQAAVVEKLDFVVCRVGVAHIVHEYSVILLVYWYVFFVWNDDAAIVVLEGLSYTVEPYLWSVC